MFLKLVYLLKTSVRALSIFKWAIWAFFWRIYFIIYIKINIEGSYIYYKSLMVQVKSYYYKFLFLISSTFLVVRNTFLVVWNLYFKFQAWKLISILFMVRKYILKTISSLILANKKLFSKNLILLSLFNMEKIDTTILLVFKIVLSIFWASILVFCILNSKKRVKAWLIALLLLSGSNKAFIYSLKITKY